MRRIVLALLLLAGCSDIEDCKPIAKEVPGYPVLHCCLYNKSGYLSQSSREPGPVVLCNREWQPCATYYFDEQPDGPPGPPPTSAWTY